MLTRLGRHAEAVPDWDRVIELDDGGWRDPFRLRRAASLARAGDVARATAEAAAAGAGALKVLDGTKDAASATLYDCACALALVAAQGTPEADRLAARAVELLRQAAARGFPDIGRLLKEPAHDILRNRPDYVALLWDLADLPAAAQRPK